MILTTLARILRYGSFGFRRNVWLSIVSLLTLTMTLLTVAVFSIGSSVVRSEYRQFTQERITYDIFLNDSATPEEVSRFQERIEVRTGVKDVTFLGKEEVRKQFEELFQNDPELIGVITADNNPLYRVLRVKFDRPNAIDSFDSFVKGDEFKALVASTTYQQNKSEIDRFLQQVGLLRAVTLFLTGYFLVTAFFQLLNTIRLAIYSRRQEIEIMRYVGASQAYIRGPFMVEAGILALLATVAAFVITAVVLGQFGGTSLGAGRGTILDVITGVGWLGGSLASALTRLFFFELLVAVTLGVVCSLVAVRRYLRA